MEKFKQYKYIILILIVILGFAFYWFQLRPSEIRKYCSNWAAQYNGTLIGDGVISIDQSGSRYTTDYQSCLNEKGLSQ